MIPSLEKTAKDLRAMEETIIHALIARVQYRLNPAVYQGGKSGFEGSVFSLFEKRLLDQENLDSRYGRFTAPEERPYFRKLAPVERKFERVPTDLVIDDFDNVNMTDGIMKGYVRLLPFICTPGDDGNYGSCSELDVHAFRMISQRVHHGAMYVAERKFLDDRETYSRLIREGDTGGLLTLLTRAEVEKDIKDRVAARIAEVQANIKPELRVILKPEPVADFYYTTIIGQTKLGEAAYLMQRKLD